MGTGNSKENWRQESLSSSRSASASSASPSSSSWASHQSYPQYGPESYTYPPPPPEYTHPPTAPSYTTPPYSHGSDKRRLERKYSKISDDYSSLEQVVGVWNNVVRFCEEKKVRPEILFYEAMTKLDQ